MPRAKKKRSLVKGLLLPGFYISTIEEFSAKSGAYEDGGGVYSSKVGLPEYDRMEHYVSVKPFKISAPERLILGASYVGLVSDVHKNFAQLTIFSKDQLGRPVPFSALLHVSRGGVRRARAATELVKPGDVVMVKLITNWVPLQVSMEGPELGVVRASCSRCGAPLTWDHDGVLKCHTCGHREIRKVSVDYGRKELYSALVN
ncbi:exosome complex RNA-binding protein Csl4 [Tardisphaera miroshnichenkoae]